MCTQELVRFIVLLDLPNGMWQNEGEARHLFRQFDFKVHHSCCGATSHLHVPLPM